jgi:SecD/SecF fusion protein
LFAGVVADLCLVLNVVLLLGGMAFIDATLTLPGLAGIVLTIGMAVDANVLIYERMREEAARGASLRMTIHNGFSRAFVTIFDSNLTTLITAVILYMIGTDQVRGFAVTLFLGIVVSMFTALYVGRLIFDIVERKRWMKSLKMLSFIRPTNLDFLSKRFWFIGASAVLIAVGMAAFSYRGRDNLDIDFSGGTMVTFSFVKPQQIDEIRTILQQVPELGTATSLERLQLAGETQASDTGRRFRIRTKEQDIVKVRKAVSEALDKTGHELVRVTMQFGDVVEVPKTGQRAAAGTGDDTPPVPAVADDAAFAGGRQVALTFYSSVEPAAGTQDAVITAATARDYADVALRALKKENGEPKYADPEALVDVSITKPLDSVETPEGPQQSTQMRLRASPVIAQADLEAALRSMQTNFAEHPLFDEVNSFDSAVAGDMQRSAIIAILASMVAIVLYVWFRFQSFAFGVGGVVALVHDVLVTLGAVALASYLDKTFVGQALLFTDFKVNLPMIAALLTIVGFSINDTIVIFDRIREVRGKNPKVTDAMVNTSLNQTLSRTILTSTTVFVVVFILYVFGGEGIHGFAFCMLVGVLAGVYSTIYIASPVMIWLMNRAEAKTPTERRPLRDAAIAGR